MMLHLRRQQSSVKFICWFGQSLLLLHEAGPERHSSRPLRHSERAVLDVPLPGRQLPGMYILGYLLELRYIV